MYQIGDRIQVNSAMEKYFGEKSFPIIGHNEDKYIILGKDGWELTPEDCVRYNINRKYLNQSVWIISDKEIIGKVEVEPGTKCLICGNQVAWGLPDAGKNFTCATCVNKKYSVGANFHLN